MIRIIPILWLVFKIWMLVDAIRRREPYFWIMIIAFVPFGDLIYFFMIKVKDFDLDSLRERYRRPPKTKELLARYERRPCLETRLALGDGLVRDGELGEASNLFREVLETYPDDKDALFGMGRTQIGLEDFDGAVLTLERLHEIDRTFLDYDAWIHLAHALFHAGRQEEALASLDRLVRGNPRLSHQIEYAHYLIEAIRPEQARTVLEEALEDHRQAPRFLKRRNFRRSLQARNMLRKLGRG
ncbi:hypothetical protein ABI59_17760 [Acidobacteria bacterium Mor1]|nr:hypothetical protein ABI59_17760 [Acidobacteria bacterium Mor1]